MTKTIIWSPLPTHLIRIKIYLRKKLTNTKKKNYPVWCSRSEVVRRYIHFFIHNFLLQYTAYLFNKQLQCSMILKVQICYSLKYFRGILVFKTKIPFLIMFRFSCWLRLPIGHVCNTNSFFDGQRNSCKVQLLCLSRLCYFIRLEEVM